MHIRRIASLLAAIAAATPAVVAQPAAAQPAPTRTEWREVFSPDGSIKRVRVTREIPTSPAPRSQVAAAEVVPIEVNGPSESRFDIVFVGDGYTAAQMGAYGQHVRGKFQDIMAKEPFRSHREQFNVWQVNVVSQQSGVDNDPYRGVNRATALDMGFWCAGIERLLCVNETKAQQYASAARDVDQVVALGNSTKYGGAGGTAATASGGNAQSGEIAIHEMGHSIAGLADEYTYGRGDYYRGPEPRELNVSTYTAATMRQYGVKWARWLGQATPDGGVIDTYEGAYYHQRGIYRPSQNSLMRTLGREFNLPCREALIAAFYRETGLIDAAGGSTRLWVRPIATSKTVRTTWRVDGRKAGHGDSLDLAKLRLARGMHTVTATVTDTTPWVRDPALRRSDLTDTRTWTVGG